MVIIELKDRVPTVTGYSHSMGRKSAEEHLGTLKVIVVRYQGTPIWCREEDEDEIVSYYDGKYDSPEKHFS